MTISYHWLLDYLPVSLSVEEVSEILTSIGLEVEGTEKIEAIKGSLEGLLIGEVLSCEQHPNADKLKCTTVNIGNDTVLSIVCGAPNVAAGQKVIVAPVGSFVHPIKGDAFEIKKAKIRGELSEGMLCAEDEIGIGSSHDGIKVLPNDLVVGSKAADYFNIPAPEIAIHIGLTPNRADAMSHIGVAKDICAYLTHHRKQLFEVKLPSFEKQSNTNTPLVEVEIQHPVACPRYMGAHLSNVQVGPSPEWLQTKLKTLGIRSINNVVDITNFILHEYGQPLHAFDASKIEGNKVVVKTATAASKFISLDDKERNLIDTDLMICNTLEPMCMAGVYGGAKSGVISNTTSLFIESAYFNPMWIRKTSLHHGLRTDAATHFEKGVDMLQVPEALYRAIDLLKTYANATLSCSIVDVYPSPLEQRTVTTNLPFINRLAGKEYSLNEVLAILKALGFSIISEKEDAIIVGVPYNKVDVFQGADLVEEILRIDGLDQVVIADSIQFSVNASKLKNDRSDRESIAQLLSSIGFQEIVTNSITNSAYYPDRTDLVKMLNSLSSELDCLRPALNASGLEVINYNSNRKNTDLFLYEFGKVYTQPSDLIFQEETKLGIWCTGLVQQSNWNQKAKPVDLFYVKSIIEAIFHKKGIVGLEITFDEQGTVLWKNKKQTIAKIELVGSAFEKIVDLKNPIYYAEINWDQLLKLQQLKIQYKEVSKFPSVKRDLSILVNKSVAYQAIKETTDALKIEGLSSYGLFDIFESEKIGIENRSLSLNYQFQSQDATFTDADIEAKMQQIINAYSKQLNAIIRS